MGIELPRELADLAAATGLAWPEADEDELREQAAAWREAHHELLVLAAEADEQAGGAVAALSRDAGDAAGHAWSEFVDPENGHFTAAARGAAEAADRLDTAAEHVGAAKVELVRQLVDVAKNRDASFAAADGGHPTAVLGVDTAVRGAAANLAGVTSGLVAAFGPEPVGSLVTPLVEPNPGARTPDGQGALLGVVTGLPADVVGPAVEPSPAVLGTAAPSVPGPSLMTPANAAPGAVAPPVVPSGSEAVPEPGPEPAPEFVLADTDTDTGPIELPDATPPAIPQYSGLLRSGGFDDVPTPSTGLPTGLPNVTGSPGFAGAVVPLPPLPPPPPPPAPGASRGAGYAPPAHFGNAVSPFAPDRPATPPQPHPPQPADPPQAAPARHEQEKIVALFRVHMFPIGHLPVAMDKPARQLPEPPCEVEFASGLRFPPHDHPRADLIRTDDALAKVQAGYGRLPAPSVPAPPELLADHDPLGGLSERDWARRFLAGKRGAVPEYAWPPGERYPEGGTAAGEPEVLAEGTVIDRFGDPRGRVFAPAGTAFAARSLPPTARESGYRRYRVLRETPVWRAESAPWFGQPGGGKRYRAVYSADELVTLGYLADITFEEAES